MPGESLKPRGSDNPPHLSHNPLVNGHPLPLLPPLPPPTGPGVSQGKGETTEGATICNGELLKSLHIKEGNLEINGSLEITGRGLEIGVTEHNRISAGVNRATELLKSYETFAVTGLNRNSDSDVHRNSETDVNRKSQATEHNRNSETDTINSETDTRNSETDNRNSETDNRNSETDINRKLEATEHNRNSEKGINKNSQTTKPNRDSETEINRKLEATESNRNSETEVNRKLEATETNRNSKTEVNRKLEATEPDRNPETVLQSCELNRNSKTENRIDVNFGEFGKGVILKPEGEFTNTEALNMNVVLPPLWRGEQGPLQDRMVNGGVGEGEGVLGGMMERNERSEINERNMREGWRGGEGEERRTDRQIDRQNDRQNSIEELTANQTDRGQNQTGQNCDMTEGRELTAQIDRRQNQTGQNSDMTEGRELTAQIDRRQNQTGQNSNMTEGREGTAQIDRRQNQMGQNCDMTEGREGTVQIDRTHESFRGQFSETEETERQKHIQGQNLIQYGDSGQIGERGQNRNVEGQRQIGEIGQNSNMERQNIGETGERGQNSMLERQNIGGQRQTDERGQNSMIEERQYIGGQRQNSMIEERQNMQFGDCRQIDERGQNSMVEGQRQYIGGQRQINETGQNIQYGGQRQISEEERQYIGQNQNIQYGGQIQNSITEEIQEQYTENQNQGIQYGDCINISPEARNQTSYSPPVRELFTLSEDELFDPSEWQTKVPPNSELYPKPDRENLRIDLKGAMVNVDGQSEVHIGHKSVYEMTPGSTPEVNVMQGDGSPQRLASDLGNGNINININTPPVTTPLTSPMTQPYHPLAQAFPGHSPLLQTTSDPVIRNTPPAPPIPRPSPSRPTSQHPQLPQQIQPQIPRTINNMMPATPPSSGINVAPGGEVLIGTKIVINAPPCSKEHKTPTAKNPAPLENLLTEVREKLSTVYIRQTRTSFLPWLKGHQVIPMTDFYTNSRILKVDQQGKQTRTSVNLVRDLMEKDETQYLVEGEPGMGKTLLALKLAIDWANKESLQKFKFVFLIFLRDFKGSLETYVKEELLPSYFEEKFRQVWDYCKENENEVLFILDGYDELESDYEGDIKKLLHNYQDFQNSKVVVTARPGVLKTIAQRTVVKGFSEDQMFEFITKYFKLINEDENGRNLNRIIEKDDKYKKLAKRPLFCVLLCMLYGTDGVSKAKLPQKLSDMMFKIMLCLIKWNIKKGGNVDENTEDFPPTYKELFLSFGKLCLQALKTEKTRFSKKEIESIPRYELLLHLGFLSNDSDNDVLGPKTFWKPVHKIFLEYLAGLYMASHIEQDRRDCRECREFSKVYRHEHVLKFVVGILGKRAHLALNGRKHQELLQMKDQELLMLLRETELTRENCRAVAKLLDRRNAIIYTSEVDFEGWSYILAQSFKRLKTLEIVWRIKSNNPDQESSFNEASPQLYSDFFNALRSNTSITKISIRATQDGEPFSDKKIELFFSHLQRILNKENLRELEIKELKMRVSEHLRKAIEGATCNMDKKALESLEILRLDMYLRDEDLGVVCDRLRRCATNLKELQLTGLEHGHTGFKSLVELLKKNKNLHKLCLSMNKESLTNAFNKENLTPHEMKSAQVQMPRQATRNSKEAFRRQEPEQKSQRASPHQDPTRELSYLFHDHLHTGVRYVPKLRSFHFISGGGETRIPLPLCVSNQHASVFHTLFSALPESNIRSLTLDYPSMYLNTLDLVCLGDTVRRARHLSTLKMLDLKTAESCMPVLLGLGQSHSLKTVKLESRNVVITDIAFQLACKALRHNTALRTLSLAHWEFNLQDKALCTQYLHDLLSSWKVGELNMGNCTIDVSGGLLMTPILLPPIIPPIPSPIQHWVNIKTLKLSEVKVKDNLGFQSRGHLLLPVLRSFPNLTNLDLSAAHNNPTTLDDNAACMFFKILGTNFKKLQELTLGNWEFKFENYEQTCGQIGNMVRSCSDLKVLVLDKVREVRSGPSLLTPCRITFLHQLVNNLPKLAELSLCYYKIGRNELSRDMASCLGACFHDHWTSPAKFKLKFFRLSADVEAALHEALKKENVDVVVSQGFPLVFTVRRGYFLRT